MKKFILCTSLSLIITAQASASCIDLYEEKVTNVESTERTLGGVTGLAGFTAGFIGTMVVLKPGNNLENSNSDNNADLLLGGALATVVGVAVGHGVAYLVTKAYKNAKDYEDSLSLIASSLTEDYRTGAFFDSYLSANEYLAQRNLESLTESEYGQWVKVFNEEELLCERKVENREIVNELLEYPEMQEKINELIVLRESSNR